MADIFIAHVEEDSDIALGIALGLEKAGYSTWCYEADNIPGPSYLIQTGLAVEQAKTIVVVISPHSVGSRQVTKEIVRAHESGKEFIPVRRNISHLEFQNRQPEWREAIGAASSIEITKAGIDDVIMRITDGLKALGVIPSQRPDPDRVERLRRVLAELPKRAVTGGAPKAEVPGAEEPAEQPGEKLTAPGVSPAKTPEKTGKSRKRLIIASIAAGAVVVIAIVVILLGGFFTHYSLEVIVNPDGGGTVEPAGGTYKVGTSVTLTAISAPGYAFDKWGGDITGEAPSTEITMNQDKAVTAFFKAQYQLTASVSPEGGGTVAPAGGIYDADTKVTLTATPAPGYAFDRWSGDVSGESTSIIVSMDGKKNVTALFKAQYQLATSVSPEGGGTVEPPGGIYDADSKVILTATPAPGYAFDRWGGDITGDVSPVMVDMDGEKSITAYFKVQYQLAASVTPEGGGTVEPAEGIYDADSKVILTATPAPGYAFDRWSGDITGETASATVVMDSGKSVTAHFIKILAEDRFDDNQNKWYTDASNYIANGVYNVKIPVEGAISGVTRRNYLWPDESPGVTDFGFELDVIPIQVEDKNGRGIIFLVDPMRSASSRPARRFNFSISGYGRYNLFISGEGKDQTIVDWTDSQYINKGIATNRLKVICRDSVIELYVNNHLLKKVENFFPDDVGDNGIGVLVSGEDGTHVAFDNLRMWVITD